MKFRSTIILLILGVGMLAYIQFFHKKQLTTEEKEQRKSKPFQLDRDKVDSVTLRNAEGTFEFKRVEGNWKLEAPVKDNAETMNMTALLTSVESLNWTSVPNSKDGLKEFGLSKGDVSLKFTGRKGLDEFNADRENVEILMGKDAAVEGKVYYRIDGSDTAYLGSKDLREQSSKGVSNWRSRTLSDVTATQVTKLSLKTAKGELELEKQGTNWSFTKPFKARGDNQKISDFIANVTTARIDEFVPDSKELGSFGLNDPRATLTLTAEGHKEPVVLLVGNTKTEKKEEKKPEPGAPPAPEPPMHVYVKLSTREGVFTVPSTIVNVITTQPNDLRDQSLMRVQSDIVDRITIESPKGKIVLGRNGEEWVRKIEGKNDEPINSAAAGKLLNELVNVKVSRMVADMASELKGFGLDQPSVTVTLSSYSTEGTPETKPGEKPIVKLFLGRFEGDAGYAKLDDEPFIVAVPSSLQEIVWTDPVQWQDLKITDLKKDDITALEITRSGQPALSLVNDKVWKPAKGDAKLNQTNLQSLLNTVSALRAVRWVGVTNPAEHGTDKPSLVVTYTTADKKSGKITIGKVGADEMWNATIEGRPGTFLINQGDFDAFNATLVEGEKTAATPAPAPASVTTPPAPAPNAVTPAVPAPAEAPKPQETPKPTEVPGGSAKPAPESAPKP